MAEEYELLRFDVKGLARLNGHRDAVYCFAPSEDNSFYTGGGDGWVVRWQPGQSKDGKLAASLPAAVYSLSAMPEEGRLIAGVRHGGIYVLDIKDLRLKRRIEVEGDVFALAVTEGFIIAGTGAGVLYVIDRKDFSIKEKRQVSEKSCRSLALGSSGQVASGWSDGHIRIYDGINLREEYAYLAHEFSVFSLCWTKLNAFLISGGRDGHIKAWESLEGFSPYMVIPAHNFTVNDLCLHPSGRYFASASRDKTIKLWDAHSFELRKVLDLAKFPNFSHTHSVNKLFWLDDTTLVSGGDDRAIRLWQVQLKEE